MRLSTRAVITILSVLLFSTAVAVVMLYPLATRPLVRPGEEALVERARRDAVAIFQDAQAHRAHTFPIVFRLIDRTCVELRSRQPDGGGSYLACYDRHTGAKLVEIANGGF